MSKHTVALMLSLGSFAQAEKFVVITEMDQSCSTWSQKSIKGVQDVCQLQGNAAPRGITNSPTGKLYIKRTCNTTHFSEGWYSDSACTNTLVDVTPSTLACSWSSLERSKVVYTCGQEYTAARWSRHTDSICQIKDTTLPEEFYAFDFCRQSTTDRFEGSSKSQKYSCGASGMERTLFKNSDCTGESWVKTDSAVSNICTDSWYYYGNVTLDVACTPSASTADASIAIQPLSLTPAIFFWLLG